MNTTPESIRATTTHLSRYAARLLDAEPRLWEADKLEQPFSPTEMEKLLAQSDVRDEAGLSKALRILRKRVMLRLIARDLNGLADLTEVMATATALAEISIRFALTHLHGWFTTQYSAPIGEESSAPQELIVVGMGKLGGTDLNVSSDIDLIFVYPEDGETNGAHPLSNQEYFSRLGRKLIAAIQERTADGYVFRVDMRLRPYGDSGPLVASFAMLEEYLVTQGREWERYAWIKGRALTGNRMGELEEIVRPFIYRKYLDFGAFASMRDLHAQIRREVARKDMADNIKLGPGGIREIEFIVQVFQLIRGGKLPELQIRPTLTVLDLLVARNLLPAQAGEELRSAYIFLRNLELIAEAMHFVNYAAFLETLDAHRTCVTRHFDQVFAAPQSEQQSHPLATLWQGTLSDADAVSALSALGYHNAESVWQWLTHTRAGGRYSQFPQTTRARFDALLPPLIEVAAGFPNPDETLERILHLLEKIGRRESYLALMVEYPQTLNQIAKLCSASPWAADYLAQHPILLDELLDTRSLYDAPDWQRYATELRKLLDQHNGDTEQQMDALRHFKHARTFNLLAQDLAGLLPLEILSDHLSALADLILSEVLRLAWQGLRHKHAAQHRFAIIGYGKLGGKE
jgi:glutamate-ammonia-ligase adenylyltransferase